MPHCTSPLTVFRGPGGISFAGKNRWNGRVAKMQVPCGQCMDCRLEKSRNWAVRMVHESQEHEDSCFITLTYNEENLPEDLSICKKEVQLFIKRLRKLIKPKKIRYYAVGEYGSLEEIEDEFERIRYISRYGSSKLGRPHYHAIIFNYWPEDSKKIVTPFTKEQDDKVFESESLAKIWNKGFHTIGECTFETAAYVARYVTKKINQNPLEDNEARFHYKGREPEFALMSRGGKDAKGKLGGIGARYFEKYEDELWNNFKVVSRGREISLPRYYKNKLKDKNKLRYRSLAIKNMPKISLDAQVDYERIQDIKKHTLEKQAFFDKSKI